MGREIEQQQAFRQRDAPLSRFVGHSVKGSFLFTVFLIASVSVSALLGWVERQDWSISSFTIGLLELCAKALELGDAVFILYYVALSTFRFMREVTQ